VMDDTEFVDEAEQVAANDPAVGTGTPQTAPHESAFDEDDALDTESESGAAEHGDDDALDDDDIGPPIDENP
jgi:hypothetical protein